MARPKVNVKDRLNFKLSGDEVVISGISGVFPNSDSVNDFMENLYNKIDMVTSEEPKWLLNDPDIPKHMGTIKGADKFDAQFFGVTFQLACVLEPMGKKLLEHAYGAIIDSGTSPQSVRGKRVGVFVGSSFTDTSALSMFDVSKRSDFIVNGCSKAMLANRISYWIDGKGPSFGLDYSCASSTACLEIAYRSIKDGECDAALVGGCNFGQHPTLVSNMRRAGLLCLDGKTKCFDKNADGYVRADAINVIFLQKAKDARRVYAQVYHVSGNYKMRPDAQFLPLREPEDIESFLRETYSEIGLDPKKVEYVEAHGAAIAKADANELQALSQIFAEHKPIKVGSVKSNMGNSEPASGVCALTKLCLAYHKGKLPGNLHYNEPQDIPAIRDGKVHIVAENEDFNRGFSAVNSFSFTGANFHVVLKGHYKEKNLEKYKSAIPHIVLASGRQETCVEKIFGLLKSHRVDPEEIGLIHKTYEHDIPGHTGRGYTILDTNEDSQTVSISESMDYYPGVKRPLWFVYSGMGSQWAGMGADLMKIPTFAAAIQKCHKVLEPKGLDLIRIVTEQDDSIFDNILNAFVGIGAIQIGLTDVMKKMGVVPDYTIGHSLGEMACAYHDNTFTAEELILSTYSRGKVCLETPLIKGSMAAVGLGYQAIVHQCPPEIDVACHNSSESSTISGPADAMKQFVEDLTKRGVFAKEVPCANIAYHSRYIAHAGPELLRRLREVIKDPKPRSNKWISTSVPQEKWHEPNAVYSSAEYHTNNLLNPVLFEEMSKLIPSNAIVVEIAPHGLLQAILKRSHTECTHIPLTRRGNRDGVKFFLEAIGKLYQAGVNPKVETLYPKIEFPVSTETPLLSHFVEWEHSEDWPMLSYLEKEEIGTASARNVVLSIHDDDYQFLEGHTRRGMNVLPESAILVLVWETLAMHMGVNYKDQSVVFRDIHFHSEVNILPDSPLRLLISITRGNNKFEVSYEDTRIASGIISGVRILKFHHTIEDKRSDSFEEEITLSPEDVYTLLNMRGYNYKNAFKSIVSTNLDRNQAYVKWNQNWVTFLDSLLQLYNLTRDFEGESTPKFIQKLRISVMEQEIANTVDVNGINCFNAMYDDTYRIIRCAGVEIDNVTFVDKPIPEDEPYVLGTKSFFPYYTMEKIGLKTALMINMQIIQENISKSQLKLACHPNFTNIVQEICDLIPGLTTDIISLEAIQNLDFFLRDDDCDKCNVLVLENVLSDQKKLNILQNLSKNNFILVLESEVPKLQSVKANFMVITSMSDGKHILMLLKRKHFRDTTFIPVKFDNFDWMSRVAEELQKTKKVVLVSERQPYCGALGFVKKLQADGQSKDKISVIVVDDFNAPTFDPNSHIFKEQLEKNLTVNVLKKGQWGGYYFVQSAKTAKLRNFILTTKTSGDLDGLAWEEAVPASVHKNNLVQVSYAGISLKDVQQAVGNTDEKDASFGMDFSGINSCGERVMGLVSGGALSNTVAPDPLLLWPVPSHWTLQDAATVPLPYALAYYCLVIRSNLQSKQNVLITGGSGALGQAAISICLSLDCTVFTTVSSQKKKAILKRLFPKLDEDNIIYSRSESFADHVRIFVKGRGCDSVINCTSGSLRQAAMKCIGRCGCFLDLSDFDMYERNTFGMSFLSNERSYRAINFSNIFKYNDVNTKKLLHLLISDGIASGIVKPITRIEYAPTNISKAFRLLSSSRNIGKVVIKMRSPEILSQGLDISPRINFNSKGSYVVICDENGLGIELANWLVKRGVKNIILHSRSKASRYLQTKFVCWNKYDASIRMSFEKIESEQGCLKLFKEATTLGPVKGIFIVGNSKNENASTHIPKHSALKQNESAMSVINLDLISKQYCKELSYFVILAMAPKSATDAYTISLSKRICKARLEIGFPALILDTGELNQDYRTRQYMAVIFNAMEKSLKLNYMNVVTFKSNKKDISGYTNKLNQILNIAKLENIRNDMTLEEMKLNEVNLHEIRNIIMRSYDIDYPIDQIQRMAILADLANMNKRRNVNSTRSGLDVFYSKVDNEENQLVKSHPIIPMITLLDNGTDKDLDPKETYLTMIPGFEGRYQVFESIAERLKVKAVAVQLSADMDSTSFPDMAKSIREFMTTKFETKTKFYLLGYSFGVNIALELAALLEKEGHIGVVFCLDSSPDALKLQFEAIVGTMAESELQSNVASHVCSLMTGQESEQLKQELKTLDNWNDKINVCLKSLKGLANFSNQYKKYLLEAAYKRIRLAQEYKPVLKLESELVLIKGLKVINDLEEDYNLSKYTNKPVKVFKLESDHASILYNNKLTNIINKSLDSQLLEDFKSKNLCEKYIVKTTVG